MLDILKRSEFLGTNTDVGHHSDGFIFDTLVIGGGIAGLTAAHSLHSKNKSILLLEASERLGGAIKTHRSNGFLVECGPNTVLDTLPEIGELVAAVGLSEQQIFAPDEAKKRFVVRGNIPIPLPTSPGAFIKTPLFSGRAKWRLLCEPFVRRSDPGVDESVATFTKRRLGDEFLDYAIDPFVSGVYAGRPDQLSVKEGFPKLAEVEQRYGSLILGQILGAKERRRRKEKSKTTARMFSFTNGLDALPNAIGSQMRDCIRTNSRAVGIRSGQGVWTVSYEDHAGELQSVRARIVLYAAGLQQVGSLESLNCDTNLLKEVTFPPLSVVALGFRASDVRHPLDGFGMLVPSCEKRYVLGALFCSTLFDERAPKDHILITAFVGGARAPELAAASEDELVERTVDDLRQLLGVTNRPVFQHITYWPKAIPQYNLGYGAVTSHLRELEKIYPGLLFAGNYLTGISVAESIRSGKVGADRASQLLENIETT
jgi:protoporphyrinogen/coproporphyrinogen III oxidase